LFSISPMPRPGCCAAPRPTCCGPATWAACWSDSGQHPVVHQPGRRRRVHLHVAAHPPRRPADRVMVRAPGRFPQGLVADGAGRYRGPAPAVKIRHPGPGKHQPRLPRIQGLGKDIPRLPGVPHLPARRGSVIVLRSGARSAQAGKPMIFLSEKPYRH
jgi:hypothetical protein